LVASKICAFAMALAAAAVMSTNVATSRPSYASSDSGARTACITPIARPR